MKGTFRFWLAAALTLLLATDIGLGRLPVFSAAIYLLAGGLALGLYGFDKRASERREWRVSERTLHTTDLAFGIIGGLVAQQTFRHKISKPGFRTMTWVIAAAHVALLMLVLVYGPVGR